MRRVLLWVCLSSSWAMAGGGAETTILVVNGESPWSRRLADHYASLRDIPLANVVVLQGVPHTGVIGWGEFEEWIWRPLRKKIAERGLRAALIAYSADFPYAVDFSKRAPGAVKNRQIGRQASLTGATYFARSMLEKGDFFAPSANSYFGVDLGGGANRRMTEAERALWNRAREAATKRRWDDSVAAYRKLVETFGHSDVVHYNLACTLGRAGRVEEALDALEVAVARGFRRADHARRDEDLRLLRSTPRFQKLLKAMASSSSGSGVPLRAVRAFDTERDPFTLCVQLGYTGLFGNSDREIRRYLEASVKADGTNPSGTVYLCQNGNVRSKARQPFFAQTMERLRTLGRKVELLDKTVTPKQKSDVFGVVIGSAVYPWGKTGSTLLGGSFAESLTSFGAHFQTASQTKLTELLRHGAAGSTGTVMEPFALWHKFPLPFVHAFYAEGLSLAEAVYYSVSGPYQLAVVGDGLARPCARFVDVRLDAPPSPWKGVVECKAHADGEHAFEWFVDGRPVATGATVSFDTTKHDDGWHDVRVVAISKDAVATRSYRKVGAVFANFGPAPEHPSSWQLFRDGELVDAGDRPKGVSKPDRPGRYQTILELDGKRWRLAPELRADDSVIVVPTKPKTKQVFAPGLTGSVVLSGGVERPVGVLECNDAVRGWTRTSSLPAFRKARRIKLSGQIEIPADGWYQVTVRFRGSISFRIGKGGIDAAQTRLGDQFIAGRFAKGWYPVAIDYEPRAAPVLQVLLGGDVVSAHPKFRHAVGRELAAYTVEGDLKAVDPATGVVLVWKKTVRDVARIVIEAPSVDTEWTVEYATTARGKKWKPVKDPKARKTASRSARAKAPALIELEFRPAKLRRLRIRPTGKTAITKASAARKP